MRKRDIFLDFTSLLDVVLIILFFFILFSHFEIEESKVTAENQMAEAAALMEDANTKANEAEKLSDQLKAEIDLVRQSDAQRANNMEAILEFGQSKNIKMILNMTESSWKLKIVHNDELIGEISADSDINNSILEILSASGYASEDTIFCEFILDGSKPGSASAYRSISKAISSIRNTYKNFYYSETDISIVED